MPRALTVPLIPMKPVLTLRGAVAPGVRFFGRAVMPALVARLLQVVFQLLFRVPPALSDGPHLLRTGCRMRMLVGAEVARSASACIAHTCIVPLGRRFRKRAAVRLPCSHFVKQEVHTKCTMMH
jgi:hypothetical protein